MPERPLYVGVDARCLNGEHLRGMGKSLFELIRRTSSSGAIKWHLFGDRPDLPMHVPADARLELSVFDMKGYRFHSWEQWALPAKARALSVDVLHAFSTSMPWWQPVPTVVTVHDMIPWQGHDPVLPAGFYRDRLLPSAYHRAAAVVTISECSRRDILARWPALKPKMHVVALGVDERYLESGPDDRPLVIAERELREPYLLYLGGADPRKRLSWALQTWAGVAATGASLVVCGVERSAHAAVRRMVPRELQDRLIIAPFVGEDDMPRLYMRAAAALYPSLYEGFGLPVVEAQAVGTPILFSDVGSLSELKGPGAVVLPVDDLAAWIHAAADILNSRSGVHGPDRIARAWARQYSWDAFTDRTLAVYEEVRVKRPAVSNRDQRVIPGPSRDTRAGVEKRTI
jgi:glycosyltransferase involved in cell wall biosynthesis